MIFYLRKLTVLAWFCVTCCAANAQEIKPGTDGIKAADSLYNLKLFKKSSNLYFSSFKQNALSRANTNLFKAAKACVKTRYIDSAYDFLFTIVKRHGSDFFEPIIGDPAFKKMHPDKRWAFLLAMIDKQRNSVNMDQIVGDEFRTLRKDRVVLEDIKLTLAMQYGNNSKRYRRFKDSVSIVDSVNCYKWKSIINTYGWLGYNAIGYEAVQGEIYLYQNANIAFRKAHFPVIAEAFKSGELDAFDYAVIADKISLYDTGKQIYGTQVRQAYSTDLLPVENKDSLNIRRYLIGLKPIP